MPEAGGCAGRTKDFKLQGEDGKKGSHFDSQLEEKEKGKGFAV